MVTQVDASAWFAQQHVSYPLTEVEKVKSVLEIGPGPGVGTFELLEALPEARIVCLEPGDVPRGALLWRLRDRHLLGGTSPVEVLPLRFEEASHIGRFDLIVAHHVVCEFDSAGRQTFWDFVKDHLEPAGQALIDSHMGPTAGNVHPLSMREQRNTGTHSIERWFAAEPSDDPTCQRTETRYVMRDEGGNPVHMTQRERMMPYLGVPNIKQEIFDAGLSPRRPRGLVAPQAIPGISSGISHISADDHSPWLQCHNVIAGSALTPRISGDPQRTICLAASLMGAEIIIVGRFFGASRAQVGMTASGAVVMCSACLAVIGSRRERRE